MIRVSSLVAVLFVCGMHGIDVIPGTYFVVCSGFACDMRGFGMIRVVL